MRTARQIWPWIRPYRRYLFGGLAASLLSVVINLSIPLLTSRIIDEGITENDSDLVVRTAILMVVLILAGMAASAGASSSECGSHSTRSPISAATCMAGCSTSRSATSIGSRRARSSPGSPAT